MTSPTKAPRGAFVYVVDVCQTTKNIILTEEEKEKHEIIKACIEGDFTNQEVVDKLGLKIRQVQRLKRKVEQFGKFGVIHKLKHQPSNNKLDKKIENKIVNFLKQKDHCDFGPTFAMEKLEEQKGIIVDVKTVRRVMVGVILWKPKQRKKSQPHRQWRESKSQYGELVQYDGSYHDWNEDSEEECLLKAIDDATGIVTKAIFDDHEGIMPTFRFWWNYIEHHGRPRAIYLDKFSTYKVNHKNAEDNIHFMTQFERAMKELDIKLITAHSLEAKGRVERGFRTHQDRLIKELRLAKKKNRNDMNDFLESEYIPKHNERFSRKPRKQGDIHKPLTNVLKKRLSSIFSKQSKRVVRNDFTRQFEGRWYQLLPEQPTTVFKGDSVIIEERLDSTIHIRHTRNKDTHLVYRELLEKPKQTRRVPTVLERKINKFKPKSDHPWRQKFF